MGSVRRQVQLLHTRRNMTPDEEGRDSMADDERPRGAEMKTLGTILAVIIVVLAGALIGGLLAWAVQVVWTLVLGA